MRIAEQYGGSFPLWLWRKWSLLIEAVWLFQQALTGGQAFPQFHTRTAPQNLVLLV